MDWSSVLIALGSATLSSVGTVWVARLRRPAIQAEANESTVRAAMSLVEAFRQDWGSCKETLAEALETIEELKDRVDKQGRRIDHLTMENGKLRRRVLELEGSSMGA